MKERLTGAIILVALIVLLVPELLTGPIREKPAPVVAALALPSGAQAAHSQPPLRTYTMTLTPGPAPAGLATPAVASPSAQTAGSREELQRSAANAQPSSGAVARDAPQQQAEAGSSLQPAKTPALPAVREARSEGTSGGWVVQLGSFASRQNADRLARALSARGFRMSVSPARTGARVLWRVRAGPAPDRAGAGRLAARLRARGYRGELLPVR